MRTIDISNWKRKQLYEHFLKLADPYFGVTTPLDVTTTYGYAKNNGISFFGLYLHSCMHAINSIENLKYRIIDENVVIYDVIHASTTIMRPDKTFGFSFVDYDEDFNIFMSNLNSEKHRILNSSNLYPTRDSIDCIYCSALPWMNFSGHKEPVTGKMESVPKLAFGKMYEQNGRKLINVAISANHALVDGYHVGQFVESFQKYLDDKK